MVAPFRSSGLPQRPAGILERIAALRTGSFCKDTVLSVDMYPGAMALTFTPCDAHSLARAFVRLPMAPLLAAYPGTPTPPWKVSMEAVKMILPDLRWSMSFPISLVRMNWALRLTWMTVSQYSSEWSLAGARLIVPALLTRMSMIG